MHEVLRQTNADGIEPTKNTWRGTKVARKARRSDIADSAWDVAVIYPNMDVALFTPQVLDVELQMSIYVSKMGEPVVTIPCGMS
jgi:hypothetical protein